jgi:hypothetical protein
MAAAFTTEKILGTQTLIIKNEARVHLKKPKQMAHIERINWTDSARWLK